MTTTAMSMNEIHANSLLASTFTHPREVLASPFLDMIQKRCILATWASDAFAVEGKPWLRQIPGSSQQIRIGDILAALRTLDGDDGPPAQSQRMPLPKRMGRTHAVGQTACEMKRLRADIHL
ncbi:hypothetical protein [Tardiphaga sp. 42S5]|uniref:hypothetical protein n=1 Tax=Tardiphaga sp. 42S5 TaxID=1404799 RepID=UPI002A5A1328|nr:hypothetical protein [Tardiphaga sp. 42S5]WPO39331.1 hypothetical protein SFY93_17405 [Tardiphaga sp. 42S5]